MENTLFTSSTAQGDGGRFKNRKHIGEVGCCESRMAERIHWWTERWLKLCFLEWLQWFQWSPHPQLLDEVWCSAVVVWSWQHQKRSNSARRPQFSKLTTSKMKQFCEASFKNGKLSAELTASYQCVLLFFHSTCLKYCACHEKVMPGHMKCCTCHAKYLSKPEDLMLQNANPLRKSAPGPPNSSDEHVSCTAPATENASLQILCICPTPAIVFETATKSSRFAHFWQGAQSSPATQNDIWTSKSAPCPSVFCTLTSKCASRHNGVHFFDISTSKSALNPSVFYTFDFEMCFAPQRRALFRHRNFQKWSEAGVFCTYWLRNVLCATTACAFSTSKLLKVVRSWSVLYVLTWKCAFRHEGVQLFMSDYMGPHGPP